MSYCDIAYLAVFLPLTILIYNIIPQRHRAKVLLLASYAFFWSISRKLIIYILISTVSIYFFGIWLYKIKKKGM